MATMNPDWAGPLSRSSIRRRRLEPGAGWEFSREERTRPAFPPLLPRMGEESATLTHPYCLDLPHFPCNLQHRGHSQHDRVCTSHLRGTGNRIVRSRHRYRNPEPEGGYPERGTTARWDIGAILPADISAPALGRAGSGP